MANKSVTLTFNINDHGRMSHWRKYDVTNVRQVLESAQTKERIAMREAYGYYGHGRRQITGKLNIGEVETVQTPSGAIILENLPACVTTSIHIDDDGTVVHTQEILDTDPGKAVQALLESKVGGFSWAMGGTDGGKFGKSKVNGYYGMDYVLEPGFAKNRAFPVGVFESALSQDEEQAVLESMMAVGMDEEKAKLYANTFFNPYLLAAELHQRNEDAVRAAAELESGLDELRRRNEELQAQMDAERAERELLSGDRREAVLDWAKGFNFVVPAQVLEAIGRGDMKAELAFFESAVRDSAKIRTLPLQGIKREPLRVPAEQIRPDRGEPEYGSIQTAPQF